MSLTAKLTISIFDAVCNFRTRQTVSITTRFPTIVITHINEQMIITITKLAVLRVTFVSCNELFVLLISSSSVVDDNNGVVDCICCREGLNIVVPFVGIMEDEDRIRCCC